MATLTKQEIIQTFIGILEHKPFKQITVKDIVEECGINRKTFYYYFTDIYKLADDYFRESLQNILCEYPSTGVQWLEGMKAVLKFFQNNKKITMNMYNSLDHLVLEELIFKTVIEYSKVYIDRKSEGRNIADIDRKNISEFIANGITGSIIKWVRNGLNGDPGELIDRYIGLCGGSINYLVSQLSLMDKTEKE